MAMSLEDLLAEEGFKRRNPNLNSIIASEGRSKTLSSEHSSGPLMIVEKTTGRMRSDIHRYDPKAKISPSGSLTSQKITRNDKLTRIGKREVDEKSSSYRSRSTLHASRDAEKSKASSSKSLAASEMTEDVETVKNRTYKVYGSDSRTENDVITMKQHALTSDKRSFKASEDENKIDESRRRQTNLDQTLTIPALDEISVKAVVSILTGYLKSFLKDGEFRSSLRHNCFASLKLEGLNTESRAIENLEQAIETVERAAEEKATLKEVKCASLQLSVITGLNSSSSKEGFTSGIPNFQLSACAHLYLSIVYVMQRKDGISSKHLLQVFCDSPFQARTVLLPDLWERLFQAHLSHLKSWYEKEANYLADSPDSAKHKFRERVYNEVLDKGTRKFAMYYKDWITEGVEAPSIPFIETPFSVQEITKEGLHKSAPVNRSLSPQPMVSKRLYDEVFKFSQKSGSDSEVRKEEDVGVNVRSVPEEKQLILDTCTNTNPERDHEISPDDIAMKIEAHRRTCQETPGRAANISEDDRGNDLLNQENSNTHFTFLALPPPEENKSETESLENSVVELKQIEVSVVTCQCDQCLEIITKH